MSAGSLLARPTGLRKFDGHLTIVCGPPGAGKSTWCREKAQAQDVIIDLDEIKGGFSGVDGHATNRVFLARALTARNEMLRELASKTDGAVFFIVTAPTAVERQWWVDRLSPAEIVVLETGPDLCRERCASRNSAFSDQAYLVGIWWKKYSARIGDRIVREP